MFINELTFQNKYFFSTTMTMVYESLAFRPLHEGCFI